MKTDQNVLLSVIVPAHQAEHLLPITLGALVANDFPRERWELIVVDDGSRDDSAIVAGRYADTVIRLPGRPHGPAYARNRGVEVARGEFVLFFDSDVRVRPDTLTRFADALTEDPTVGAIFGSYDTVPAAPGLVSQYRNLLHHFVHQGNGGEVQTFWAGCGGVRRSVLELAGLYDEWHFARPQIEDIELGQRIRALGHRILLRPEIQVTHLKVWTLASLVRTDIRDRGIPWARLLAHRGALVASGGLNLRWTEKANTVLVWLMVIGLIAGAWRRSSGLLIGSSMLIIPVLLLTLPLLTFFVRTRGVLFTLGIIPLHVQYYFLNGISAVVGVLLHETIGAPTPDPTTDAFAEVGLQKWPPVPSKERPSSWGNSSKSE